MPQETNLNVAPYFDDFDAKDEYYKTLFKPGYPVQARELTGMQSALQDQIEKFGSHIFKEGSSVTGGGIKFSNAYESIKIQPSNKGFNVQDYLLELDGKILIGSESGIKLQVKGYMAERYSDNSYVVFVNYLNSGSSNNPRCLSGESLLLDGNPFTTRKGILFQPGESVAQLMNGVCTFVGCAAVLSEGIYFARGYFIQVKKQTTVLSPFVNSTSAQVGLRVVETIINSDIDSSLTDNAAGYSNYTAPGADRLSIDLKLESVDINQGVVPNFIPLLEVRGGVVASSQEKPKYNDLSKEFARRTFDESGNYYVRPFNLTPRDTLNNFEGNNGIFDQNQKTYNNNDPRENLGTYKLSPGKAYIEGYEVETLVPSFLDFKKPRTTKLLENQSINYVTGPTFTLNRVSGSPHIGVGTDYTVSLRDERVGAAGTTAAGKEIGLARVYDFALESGSYDASNANVNEWDIALYDIQTYTDIALNTPTTLAVPTHIKGKSSGATGYLRNAVTSSTSVTAYNTKGKFITGEQFIFNGIESGNIAAGATSYTTSDIKSINGTVSTASTFNADVKQSNLFHFGEVNVSAATTSGAYLGISTVTSPDPTKFFIGIATVGNIIEYTNTNISGVTTTSYARVESVSQNSLTISGVTTVAGICEGGLPTVIAGDSNSGAINPSNFKILTSQFQSSTDNTLFTPLPKRNISNVDLTNSSITIRKQFDVTITNSSTGAISSGDSLETFLPFDEERYVLIRTDGTTESLSADKINFNTGSTEITINGLGGDSPARLIATLRKVNVKAKIKEKQKINVLTIANSKDSSSGIGTTTLNDGLTYGTVYGTRVQDEDISLNVSDVTKIYAVLESNNTNDPIFPRISLRSINSTTGTTGDLLIGETFKGDKSNAKGVFVSNHTDSTINYVALNDYNFQTNETVTFAESSIEGTISSSVVGSNNITEEFTYDDGQRNTLYDYGRMVRKSGYNEPSKKLSIVFESAYFTSSDTGDITTVNSYDNFDYKNLPTIETSNVSDILDIRPRVSDFSGTSRSPFEFLGRDFTSSGNSASNILASDESIILDYSFYLPRLDKIYLNKNGTFQLVNGIPAETPEWPNSVDGALEVASISLPAFLYNPNDINISLANYKRYQMRDINRLEKRIENLEFYTSLSLLERDTLNMQITDTDGLNRFKSGFFVDDFSTTDNQLKKTIVKNSIDYKNGELRPSPYTTELDLKIDSDSFNGIRQTGRVLSLEYAEVPFVRQPYATKTESVTPFLINYYGGSILLTPTSDVWVDQVVLDAKLEDLDTYTESQEQVEAGGWDPDTGYSPVVWGGWETTWTGGGGATVVSSNSSEGWGAWSNGSWGNRTKTRTTTTTFRNEATSITEERKAKKSIERETFSTINEGPKVLNTNITPYMRSRNLDFSCKGLKPTTSVFGFFDGENINKFIVPKLLEISMTTGTFQVGETVIGTTLEGKELIRFRVATSNHKMGEYNNPGIVYNTNPYYAATPLRRGTVLIDSIIPTASDGSNTDTTSETILVPAEYSSTSTILNVDTLSLSDKSENIYYGYVEKGLKLVGQTSSAQATITNLHLRTDNLGSVRGSFFIPNPNDITTPKFEAGKKVFRLTSSSTNSQSVSDVGTDATQVFDAAGSVETVQSTIISVRNIHTHTQIQVESRSSTSGGGGTYTTSSSEDIGNEWRPGPPQPPWPPICSTGYHWNGKDCVPDDVPPEPCPSGWSRVNGVCVPDVYIPYDEVDTWIPDRTPKGKEGEVYWRGQLKDSQGGIDIGRDIDVGAIVLIDETTKEVLVANEYGNPTTFDNEDERAEIVEAQNLTVFDNYSDFANAVNDNGLITNVGQGGNADDAGDGRIVAFVEPATLNPIEQAYVTALGRPPDKAGAEYWANDAAYTAATTEEAKLEVMLAHLDYSAEGTAVVEQGDDWEGVNSFFSDNPDMLGDSGVLCANVTDPLAQTFFVQNDVGVFITRADLFMATKDETLPLIVQLRTVKLGVPTDEVIPFGEVILEPNQIGVSDNSTVITPVVFPGPVYLSPNQTYALVLLSVSSNYSTWISRVGEVDIKTVNSPESDQLLIASQPSLGSLFKSQNGETWNASQWEDLKFTLFRATYGKTQGTVNFTNPSLFSYSDDINALRKDSLEISSNKIRIGFNTTISDTAITVGNIISQQGSNATGNYVGSAGTASGNLTITNSGVGYTPSSGSETYNHVPMVTQTGSGRNGTLNLTITNGVAIAATVVSGGSGYSIGDIVGVSTVGLTSLGQDIKFSIAALGGVNEYILDNVQGEFITGVGKTIQYTAGAAATDINGQAGGNVWLSGSPVTVTDGLHVKINQKNHGMHGTQDVITLTDVQSDITPTKLSTDYDSSSTGSIVLDDASDFAQFENVGVGSTNLGYVKVGSEILSYSGVSNNTLSGVTRGVDSTQTLSHDSGDYAHKYELNGVSLRRINTNHTLSDASVTDSSGIDYYNIKIDTSTNGVNRSVGTSIPILHFNQTKSTGGEGVYSTDNIPFEVITPIVQNITPTGTNISGAIRTITGSSVDGSETPYQDKGFEEISLITKNFMSSPRMIASRINETTSLPNLPNNKSFTLSLFLETNNPAISPIVDLDRVAMIFTSNRLNNPITNWITDNRVNTLKDDPNAFVYASKPVGLENGATSIKIHLEAHINITSDVRAFYALMEDPNDELVYQPFPGYDNLLSTGQVVDPAKNSGLPDKLTAKTDVIAYTSNQVVWNDYEFSIDNLPTFKYFSVKLVGTGTNQAQPPRMKNLRVLALA